MSINKNTWAPLPLRLALGGGLIFHGGIKLFADGGHENIAHMIALLGIPFPEFMGWVVGLVEFLGGLGILFSVFYQSSLIINILNVLGLVIFGFLAGGIPQPLPGGDPLPEYREAFCILAGLVTLSILGAGKWALSRYFIRQY